MKKHFFVLAAGIISTQLWSQGGVQTKKALPEPASPVRITDTATQLDPVTITATKFPLKTSKTGKVVLVITREQLEKSGGKDLSQVLAEQAGLFIAGSGSNPGKDKSPYLRGARIDHTLISINGIPVYDPSGIGGNFDLRNLSVDNIERIEILKGSQSTLYGSDAIAGVINIITRSITSKKIAGNINASFGSWRSFNGNTGFSGKSEKLEYSAAYSFRKSDGINETVNNNSAAITDKDGYTQNNLQFALGITPSKKIYFQPFLRYNNISGDLDQGAYTDELDFTYRQKSLQSGFASRFSLGKTKIYASYNYNTINRVYTDDSVKSRNGFDTYSKGSYKGQEHFSEVYAVTELKVNIKLTGGFDFRSSQSDQEYFSVGFFGPYTSKYGNDSLRQNQLGVYAAAAYNGDKGLNIEAGSRINFHSAYGNHAVFNFNPSFLINKKIKLFANISSAYRTPSLYQLYSEYGNKKLKPEAAVTAEGGIQYYPNSKWMTRATVFNRNVKNVVFFYTNPSTFASQYINQDKQKDRGFELEAVYNPTTKVSIKGFYTFVTGEIKTKKGVKDTTYNNLLRRPKNSLGVNIGVQVTPQLFISSHLSLVGKRYDSYFDSQTFQLVNTELDSYTLWDIYTEYHLCKKKLKLFTHFRNLLNSHYTEISGFNTQRFNVTGGARFSF